MHIILTHEQADFDALAALLGAALLDEHAIPVLPRRTNRNVRSFLNIYQTELPFIEPRDLQPGPISTITLVDTQSLVTLKGITKNTLVSVIDHHKIRKDLPEDWQTKTDTTGACATLLVENLRSHDRPLTSLQATLLLLGIYEDTGSLSYSNTTPRDVHAVAYLLEQGASLQIATQFLNPPLSPEQRQAYDQFLASAVTHHVSGQNIVVSTISALDLEEEISSVAHKLRDLLDPDALILIVRTKEGIRLIARSTTSLIDVSHIMAEFGGGGHERAASALLQVNNDQPTLDEIGSQLIAVLEKHVRPSIVVGQIMSRKPLILSPEMTAQKASLLIKKHGFEGYPVARNGSVIGLLSSRSVERALAHKMNLTVESLMDSGDVHVSPRDPVEHLQRVMAATGWGQIPVIEPDTGKIIGIVTRTDLLKILGKNLVTIPGHINLSSHLQAALPPARLGLLKILANIARENRFPIYIVGGFVRDLILSRPGIDFDIVVEGDAIALGQHLTKTYGGKLVSHNRFGTAKWQINEIRSQLCQAISPQDPPDPDALPDNLDLISARSEFYEFPTALPTIERSSIKLDLHRRDFTINTLAMRLDGRHYGDLYDYWGGLDDLKKGSIRVLHSLSFIDDPTRMIRAVRFEQRFKFHIETRTLQLMDEAQSLLKQLSGDRIRHEFDLIFLENEPADTLARLEELGLLKNIHPSLKWDGSLTEPLQIAILTPIDPRWQIFAPNTAPSGLHMLAYLIWMGRMPLDELMQLALRLHFSRPLRTALIQLNQLLQDLPGLSSAKPSQITVRLENLAPQVIYTAWLLTRDSSLREILQSARFNWLAAQPVTKGEDLQKLGLPPGPAYKYVLSMLRNARVDGIIQTNEAERIYLKSLLDNLPPEYLSYSS